MGEAFHPDDAPLFDMLGIPYDADEKTFNQAKKKFIRNNYPDFHPDKLEIFANFSELLNKRKFREASQHKKPLIDKELVQKKKEILEADKIMQNVEEELRHKEFIRNKEKEAKKLENEMKEKEEKEEKSALSKKIDEEERKYDEYRRKRLMKNSSKKKINKKYEPESDKTAKLEPDTEPDIDEKETKEIISDKVLSDSEEIPKPPVPKISSYLPTTEEELKTNLIIPITIPLRSTFQTSEKITKFLVNVYGTETERNIKVTIPAATKNGTIINMKRMGSYLGSTHQDVDFHITVQKDPSFLIENNDLFYFHQIPLRDALLGGCIEISNPIRHFGTRNKISIEYQPFITNFKKKFKNKGIIFDDGPRGNLIVTLIPKDIREDDFDFTQYKETKISGDLMSFISSLNYAKISLPDETISLEIANKLFLVGPSTISNLEIRTREFLMENLTVDNITSMIGPTIYANNVTFNESFSLPSKTQLCAKNCHFKKLIKIEDKSIFRLNNCTLNGSVIMNGGQLHLCCCTISGKITARAKSAIRLKVRNSFIGSDSPFMSLSEQSIASGYFTSRTCGVLVDNSTLSILEGLIAGIELQNDSNVSLINTKVTSSIFVNHSKLEMDNCNVNENKANALISESSTISINSCQIRAPEMKAAIDVDGSSTFKAVDLVVSSGSVSAPSANYQNCTFGAGATLVLSGRSQVSGGSKVRGCVEASSDADSSIEDSTLRLSRQASVLGRLTLRNCGVTGAGFDVAGYLCVESTSLHVIGGPAITVREGSAVVKRCPEFEGKAPLCVVEGGALSVCATPIPKRSVVVREGSFVMPGVADEEADQIVMKEE